MNAHNEPKQIEKLGDIFQMSDYDLILLDY